MSVAWHPVSHRGPHPQPAAPAGAPGKTLVEQLAVACRSLAGRLRGRGAVAVGSRGIPELVSLTRQVVSALRPFATDVVVVPAMGSHGGGTPEGQRRILAELGICADTVGAEIVSTPEVRQVGTTPSGIPVWCDAHAWQLDWIVPLNRIKPHTAFRGRLESGPAKMLAVGMGRGSSARTCHRAGLGRAIPEVAEYWLRRGKVPFAVGVLEAPGATLGQIAVLPAATWLEQESGLLQQARRALPQLPWPQLDLLVVERMGKDISGTGMDLNVVGLGRRFPADPSPPLIRRVVALGLSPASRGNANGVGYADVVTRALADAVDWEVTYANARTTGFLDAVRLPLVAADEAEAIEIALQSLPDADPLSVRAVRIVDTGRLQQFSVSPALLRDLPEHVHRECG